MDQVFDGPSQGRQQGDADPSGPSAGRTSEAVAEARPPIDYEPTGVESVDRVLAEVATIVDLPVAEHVAVFERAHEQLRRALDARPDPAPDGGQGA